MNVFVFSSSNLTNIWAGIGARRWAVSQAQGENPSIKTKAKNMPVGSLGLFYCVETQSLTTPFLVRSQPEENQIVKNIWPEPWLLPFGILPLGSPHHQLKKDELGKKLPSLKHGNQRWDQLFHIQPLTVFAPSVLSEADWAVVVSELAEV